MREYVVRDKKGRIVKMSKEQYKRYKKTGEIPNYLKSLFG